MSVELFDSGTRINEKYRLIELIGEGGMGQVWKAEDIKHERRLVAIKFIARDKYGDDPEKCILFHCGSTAQSLMTAKGRVVDHSMLQHDPQVGPNNSFGCNEGRIKAFPFGFAGFLVHIDLRFGDDLVGQGQ